jgi:putative addiction module component (TIGR02574 family)
MIGIKAMNQTVEQLLQAALKLPDEQQLLLVSALTAAVEERGLRPFDDSWLEEIRRRSAEYDAGSVQTIPWAEVKEPTRQTENDPIVEEVQRVREAYAARFNYDLDAIFRDIKEKEKEEEKKGRKFVSFALRRIEPTGTALPDAPAETAER